MSKSEKANQPNHANASQQFFERSLEWKTFLWNPKTKEFLGRNALSWGKIIFFYIVFYGFLACYFAVMMTVFYHTLDDKRPKYTSYMQESRLSVPGISMRPSERTLVFDADDVETYGGLVNATNDLIDKYDTARSKYNLNDCTKGERPPCVYEEMTQIMDNPALYGSDWGYSNGTPTVLLKINKVFDWIPDVYGQTSEELPEELRQYLTTNTVPHNKMVWLWCTDNKKGVEFSYYPYPGFPAHYFPFTNQEGFLAPMVALTINSLPVDEEVKVKCTAYAENMKTLKHMKFVTLEFNVHMESKIRSE